ncbi:hypothetical protein AK812_SmicGene47586, partial [Symbiodinium microadriaticum]
VKKRRPGALISVFPKDGEIGAFEDSDFDVVGVPRLRLFAAGGVGEISREFDDVNFKDFKCT